MADVNIKEVSGGNNATPDLTDAIEIDDGTNSEYTTIQQLYNRITALTADTPVDADSIAFYDASGSATDKVTLANFIDNYLRSRATTWTGQTLTAPTIDDFTNMAHDHGDADDGGVVVADAVGLTTQGDVLYRDGSGLARLAASTAGYHLRTGGAGANPTWSSSTMIIPFGTTAAGNPADAATYWYGGAFRNLVAITAAGQNRIYFRRACTIAKIDQTIVYTAGTSENVSISLRLNDTTDTALTTTLDLSGAGPQYLSHTISVAIAVGDFIELKWVSPTWVTNPTSITVFGTIYAELL